MITACPDTEIQKLTEQYGCVILIVYYIVLIVQCCISAFPSYFFLFQMIKTSSCMCMGECASELYDEVCFVCMHLYDMYHWCACVKIIPASKAQLLPLANG